MIRKINIVEAAAELAEERVKQLFTENNKGKTEEELIKMLNDGIKKQDPNIKTTVIPSEKEAIKDIFVHDDVYDRELIRSYGELHKICPHEFSLSIASLSDVIVCDYNYAFDPRVHLIRFFEEMFYTPKLLIDEAHNMVDRSRMMYSASLHQASLESLKEAIKGFDQTLKASVNAVLKTLVSYRALHDLDKNPFYDQLDNEDALLEQIDFCVIQLEKLLVDKKKFATRKNVLDVYFELLQYRRISEFYNQHYRFFIELINDKVHVTQKCFNAANYIEETIENHTEGAVFFSATLEPIDYYVDLITNKNGQTINIPSPFDPSHLGLFIDPRTSTRYRDRDRSITPIIDTIYAVAKFYNDFDKTVKYDIIGSGSQEDINSLKQTINDLDSPSFHPLYAW